MKRPCVYVLAKSKNGAIYIGVTSDLFKRLEQHRSHVVEGFTQKYDITKLVHFEVCDSMDQAIYREKQLKQWRRVWKVALIELENPGWIDLSEGLEG